MVLAMCFLHCTLLAQATISKSEEFILSGTVINSETRKPIPHAEIFISGTTRGCISDMQGNFILEVPYIPCTLVADHISYESFITPIVNKNEVLEITLKTNVFSIEEVKISGKNKRKKNLRYFYSYFIRKNKNKFEVLNDSVLYFKSDKKEFVAYSNEPLIIINKILGYKTKLRCLLN